MVETTGWNYNSFPIPPTPPIHGPEIVSADWCEECAKGLATNALNYVKRIDDESVRQQALDLIRFLYTQAENCCKLSGLDPVKYNWKSCLAPLNAKRWHWKKKWELYGVPPHPSD